MIDFISAGLNDIFHDPSSIFLTATAKEILWQGFNINCDVKSFAGKAICGALREEAPVKYIDGADMKLSLLSMRESDDMGRFTVNRGKKDQKLMNQMTAVDGSDRINVYDVDECNIVNGSEGSFFAPKIKKDARLELFVPELCRKLKLIPTESKNIMSIQTTKMEFSLTNVNN